jgi:glucose-1-phosphate adenylyltransferase
MRMYIIEKSLLEYLVEECIARGQSDFVRDILLKKLDSLKIYGFPFEGYLANINSINAYYRHNMDLLNPDIRNEVFFKSGIVHTRVMDEVPAKYSPDAKVQNSLVSDGCVVEGEVVNSVLFRGVKVYKGASIKNSIIMQGSEIMENTILENVILDKEVIVRTGRRLTGQENYPVVVRKGAVI